MSKKLIIFFLFTYSVNQLFSQDITNKSIQGIWKIIEVKLDSKVFSDSNIDNFDSIETFFQNIKFSFSKNNLVKVETQEKLSSPFNNSLFNTVLYYNIQDNIINIGNRKKSSNILYIQVLQENDILYFNFSGALLKIKRLENSKKLKIDKNLLKSVKPLLLNKPLLNERVNENEIIGETLDKPVTTYNCSHIINKSLLKKCVSQTIVHFFNRKFNTETISNLGLSGLFKNKIYFIINKEGNLININAEPKNSDLSDEIIRTVNLLPKFIPAKKNGNPVNTEYSFPFIFQIQN